MMEEQGTELQVENEDLLEHQREKDSHRKRRLEKEKEKQKEQWRNNKPRGKRHKSRNNWDDDDLDY